MNSCHQCQIASLSLSFFFFVFQFPMKLDSRKLRIRNVIRFHSRFHPLILIYRSKELHSVYCVCMLFITNLSQKPHYPIANVRCMLRVSFFSCSLTFACMSFSNKQRGIYVALCFAHFITNNELSLTDQYTFISSRANILNAKKCSEFKRFYFRKVLNCRFLNITKYFSDF